MLSFLSSNGLNAIFLNLRNAGISVINAYLANLIYAVIFYCFLEQLWIIRCRIIMSGDIELNPGPKNISCQSKSFSTCQWNLNSLRAHTFANVSLLTVCLSVNPISSQCSILIPLKTSEKLWFFYVFRGIKREH